MKTFKAIVFTEMSEDSQVDIRRVSGDFEMSSIYEGRLGDIDNSILFRYSEHPAEILGREVNRDLQIVIWRILIID